MLQFFVFFLTKKKHTKTFMIYEDFMILTNIYIQKKRDFFFIQF